jgi:hypothetical protein
MRNLHTLTLSLALLSTLLLVACDSGEFVDTGNGNDPWTNPSGNADGSYQFPDAGPGGNPDPNQEDPTCGGQNIPIQLKQGGEIPDLYLVVDKSGSMAEPVDIFKFFETKWKIMRKTLIALVEHYQTNINFGLSVFPSDGVCGPGMVDVPLQPGSHPAITAKLNATTAEGNTPTHTTLANARQYLNSVPPGPGQRFVLLATDGMPNCGGANQDTESGPETLAEVQNLYNNGIKTFVLGFGSIIAGNPALLNQLATAGGKPNPNGPHKFFPAANEEELRDAFFSIAGGIIPAPCTYKLASLPPEPDMVTVKFDGVAVPRNKKHTSGWDYTGGGSEITFYGPDCERVSKGQVKNIEFIFGCKGPVIE